MSFWIHAYCNNSTRNVTPSELKSGIAARLKLLTYLFCPELEEDPDLVLNRLNIVSLSQDNSFDIFHLYYHKNSNFFIHISRNNRAVISELEENVLLGSNDIKSMEVKQLLQKTNEDVAFSLKNHDVQGMGFPIAIAAAAYFVDQMGGIIQSGHYSWMVPDGDEVKTLLEIYK